MPSSPEVDKSSGSQPNFDPKLLKPEPTLTPVQSVISKALEIPTKAVSTAVTNPVNTVKHAASFLFGPGLFLVGAFLAAIAWTAVKAAAIADTRIFKTFLGQNIVPDAQWQSRLQSVENSVGTMFGFCFYSFLTGASMLQKKWANYSATHVGGNVQDITEFNQEVQDSRLSDDKRLGAIQRGVEQTDHQFFVSNPVGEQLAGGEKHHGR